MNPIHDRPADGLYIKVGPLQSHQKQIFVIYASV